MLSNCVTTLIPDFITVCAVVIIMFSKNPKLAVAALISTPFMAIAITMIQVKAHPRWQTFRKKSSNLNAFLHEDMSGMKIIHSFTAEKETEETTQKNTGGADIWKLCTIVLAGGLGIGAVAVYLKYGRKKEDGFVSEQLEFTDGPFINEEQENEDGQED